MKKLLIALAGAASFAALADVSASQSDFEGITAETLITAQLTDANWRQADGDPASKVTAYTAAAAEEGVKADYAGFWGSPLATDYGSNYLALDTGGGELLRYLAGYTSEVVGEATVVTPNTVPVTAEAPVYIDTMVQFTATDSSTEVDIASDAKLAIWMVGTENDGTTTYTLKVKAGDYDGNMTRSSAVFTLTNNVAGFSVAPNTWYRLTVKAVNDAMDQGQTFGALYMPCFEIYLDGEQLQSVEGATLTGVGTLGAGMVQGCSQAFTDGKLFASLQAGTETTTLASVGFQGSGALDDFIMTTVEPNFISTTVLDFTLTWPAGVTPVSYTVGDGQATPIAAGATSPLHISVADGAAVKFVVANGDGAKKELTATAADGDVTGIDATGTTFGWPEYLGDAVDGAYEIDDKDELVLFQKGVAADLPTANTTFKLTADVALTAPWPGIGAADNKDNAASNDTAAYLAAGPFLGTFDGQNHTVSGFQMVGGNLDYCGFFNSTYQATIRNLKIGYAGGTFAADSSSSSSESGATFVGVAKQSTLSNLTSLSGTVSSAKGFGGIVGYLTDASVVEYCTNNVNLTSLKPNKAGGIAMVGQAGDPVFIRNCVNNGTTAGTADEKGGIVAYIGGESTVNIDGCAVAASVDSVPSFVGKNQGTVALAGVNTAPAGIKPLASGSCAGLNFAEVDNGVATFCAATAITSNKTYYVMVTNAVAISFGEAAGDWLTLVNTPGAYTGTVAGGQVTTTSGLDIETDTETAGQVTFTLAGGSTGGAEFADDGAEGLLDENTTVTADDVAAYVETVTGAAAPAEVTKPMVLSYMLKANKILSTPETDVIKITAIEQVSGGWKITVAAALNAADVAAGATVDMFDITGTLAVTATADLGTAFAPVAAANFSVADGEVDGTAVITVNDANAKFLKATVTK